MLKKRYNIRMKKGTKMSIEGRRNISLSHIGKKHSIETRLKMSLAQKGEKHANWGIKLPLSTRLKMSQTKKRMGTKPPSAKGRKISIEARLKLSEQRKGNKNPGWRGGVNPINKSIRHSLEYRLWREAIFKRDNYTCIWGGKAHGSKLQADHIKRFSDYPELRFAIDNGRTLCVECHRKTDTFGSKKSIHRIFVA